MQESGVFWVTVIQIGPINPGPLVCRDDTKKEHLEYFRSIGIGTSGTLPNVVSPNTPLADALVEVGRYVYVYVWIIRLIIILTLHRILPEPWRIPILPSFFHPSIDICNVIRLCTKTREDDGSKWIY